MEDTMIVTVTATHDKKKWENTHAINKKDLAAILFGLTEKSGEEELVISFPKDNTESILVEVYNGYRE